MDDTTQKWYVLLRGHHQGPYPIPLLKQWLREGKVRRETLIWQEGLGDWKELGSFEEFRPVRPSRVLANRAKAIKRVAPRRTGGNGPFLASTKDPFLWNRRKVANGLGRFLPLLLRGISFMMTPKFLAPVTCGWLVAIGYVLFFGPSSYALMKAIRVGQEDVQKLSLVFISTPATTSASQAMDLKGEKVSFQKFKFRWSKEGHKLFFSVDRKISAPVRLLFHSLQGRILAEEDVSFYTDGILKEGKVIFDEFHFTRGHYLAKGYYQVDFQSASLKVDKVGFPFTLFYGQEEALFEEQLLRYQNLSKKKELKYHDELLERFSTLTSLVTHIEKLFDNAINKVKQGKEIGQFKDDYSRQVAMVMHGVTLDHKDSRFALKGSDNQLLQEYDKLTLLGKTIGENVVNAINRIEKMPSMDLQQKKKITEDFHLRMENIKVSIQRSVQTIQSKI